MCAVVSAHVDEFRRTLDALEGSFYHSLGLTYEGNHRAVGCLAGVYVEQLYALYAFDSVGYLFNLSFVASLGEVGDTLYDTGFHRY